MGVNSKVGNLDKHNYKNNLHFSGGTPPFCVITLLIFFQKVNDADVDVK